MDFEARMVVDAEDLPAGIDPHLARPNGVVDLDDIERGALQLRDAIIRQAAS